MRADQLSAILDTLPKAWRAVLPAWTPQAQQQVVDAVRASSDGRQIAPADPIRALRLVAPQAARVVVFGQDPYPRAGHADGLAFSAAQGRPPSLRRVFEVLEADRPGWSRPPCWVLDDWARRGVLLLNPTLTVEVGAAGSHLDCGWEALTAGIVRHLASRPAPPTFLLWGKQAQLFYDQACPPGCQAPVLRTRHPSHDFRREFMAGGSHFDKTAHLVDWWGLSSAPRAHAILAGSSEGCPSG